MSKHPEVLWAQRSSASMPEKNVIFLTINLPDITESTLKYTLTSTSLSFKANAGSGEHADYAFELDFFAEVDPEISSNRLTSRSFAAVIRKKETQSEFWPRLTKEKLKTPFIKTDFSKWVDEDEQDGNPNMDEDFGVGGIPGMDDGMRGMGGMGGMDFSKMMQQGSDFGLGAAAQAANEVAESDSDDDGPPPLE
ncbi:HSP20-like chaperone [Butyriboletus roseoflavus]|nr:HSP20-like chaperone [Butyriboletus roseoflavus]